MRHEIHAIKTRPSNPLRFLQHKNSFRRYLANDLTCAARKTTFRTIKRFHNKQYPPKSKDQPFESDRTHFDTVFNNGSIAMHRQTFILLLSHKITTVQKKQQTGTINHDKQSEKTFHTTTQSKTLKKQTVKTNTTNYLINQSQKQPTQSLNQKRPQNKPSKQTQQPITPYTKICEY